MLNNEYNITTNEECWFEAIVSATRDMCEIINLNITSIESFINIFCEILTVVLLVWGCIVVKKIKEKKVNATTDFYSKLKVHLIHLKSQLGTEEFTVLNYLYDDSTLKQGNLQKPTNYKDFLEVVNSLLSFLKASDNQVIPSFKFFNNLNTLVEKLSEYTLLPEYHPFSDLNNQEVPQELSCLKNIIESLISEIELEQRNLFKNIWKDTPV